MITGNSPWSEYDIRSWNNGLEVLAQQQAICNDMGRILGKFRLTEDLIAAPGKNQHVITKALMDDLKACGFIMERKFTKLAHKIDASRPPVVVELSWNSKGTTFARDLGGFRTLYERGAIACVVIITRSTSLQPILKAIMNIKGLANKYDGMTTHMQQLSNKIDMLGQCPLVAIGITNRQIVYPPTAMRRSG